MRQPGKARTRNTPMRAEDLRLEAEALDLRRQHHSFRAIAALQGVHPSTAHERVERALAAIVPQETREAVRRQETERLDAVQARVLAALGHVTSAAVLEASGLDDEAVARLATAYARVSDRKAKLLGLDAPAQLKVEVTGALEAEVQALADELAAAAGGAPVQAEA